MSAFPLFLLLNAFSSTDLYVIPQLLVAFVTYNMKKSIHTIKYLVIENYLKCSVIVINDFYYVRQIS